MHNVDTASGVLCAANVMLTLLLLLLLLLIVPCGHVQAVLS
jgi:hypothetical protein